MSLMQNINKALEDLGPKLNFKTIGYCANNDMDAYLQNVQIYIDQKVDGFLLNFDPTTNLRFKEVLDEAKVPYIAVLNSVRDANGSEVIPCVGIDGQLAGQVITQWLFDNYKTYWGDIDKTQIGLLDFTFSPNKDFRDRHDGALATFKELLPNNTKIFDADGVVGTLNEETGYNLASAIFAAHPEVKYWFVPACLEGFAAGATRAAEAAKIEKKCLITGVNSDILNAQWDTGYNGCWVSCLALSDYQYAIPSICALIALIDGKATPDSLWASKREKTDKVTFYNITPTIVTKDTYKAFFGKVKQEAGLA
jgi:ABC-type sugar transport system substrate-binding protein